MSMEKVRQKTRIYLSPSPCGNHTFSVTLMGTCKVLTTNLSIPFGWTDHLLAGKTSS